MIVEKNDRRKSSFDFTGSYSWSDGSGFSVRSSGFTCELDVADIYMISPPSACTSGVYSLSGSRIIISSVVASEENSISSFAITDLPEPGIPNIKAFGLSNLFLSKNITFFDI